MDYTCVKIPALITAAMMGYTATSYLHACFKHKSSTKSTECLVPYKSYENIGISVIGAGVASKLAHDAMKHCIKNTQT